MTNISALTDEQKELLEAFKKYQHQMIEKCEAGEISKEEAVIQIMLRANQVIALAQTPISDPIADNMYQARTIN